jgi:hypothetical protein
VQQHLEPDRPRLNISWAGPQEAQEARFERSQGIDSPEKLLAAIASVHELAAADGRVPLTRWLANPAGPTPDEQFEVGLGFLLDGIARSLPIAGP